MKTLPIVERDEWLAPDLGELLYRHERYREKLATFGPLVDFANGYKFFGFQPASSENNNPACCGVGSGCGDAAEWLFREWLPGAHTVHLVGDFNGWERPGVELTRGEHGVWSCIMPPTLKHGDRVKMIVDGHHERIPSYIRRAVQDPETKDFSGQFWAPEPYEWSNNFPLSIIHFPLIYEAHPGMATEQERVGTWREFADDILPRIERLGYNAVQLMGVAEHPYYGSFGYHVSNFFAPSSRFGTPEDLKYLIDKAHSMGLRVIMDIVHSHYVKNTHEGLNRLDGTDHLYSPAGDAGNHPHWDSKLFDYGKDQVLHFLLSNVKYWLDEFRFDGFRFDGVTSMIFHHHGYTEFDAREKYFNDEVNRDGLRYLALANTLVHEFRPEAMTIAEDVSGMPTMCSPVEDGGIGFDYRLAMAVPDFWIKMLKEVPDEQWNVWDIWNILTDRLPYVGTIAYAESHDQALVGDKTIAFRLMDKEMYHDMARGHDNIVVERGLALHKMIRLVTLSLGGQGYLNFMGNEFGHPEWIDFPREGNGWSYAHARRQWSLADDGLLRYAFLEAFDAAMLALANDEGILSDGYAWRLQMDTENQTMAFSHGDVVFVFCWHPSRSIPDYEVNVPSEGVYRPVLSTDEERFGGRGRHSPDARHFSRDGKIKIYNVCRTAIVLKIDNG
jgi:1,4-alpha-glucan branching enzyme